jgi:hypothetical protein
MPSKHGGANSGQPGEERLSARRAKGRMMERPRLRLNDPAPGKNVGERRWR